MIELDRIYNEDCLEGMKRIPDGSVDCVICDLPYGMTNNSWDSVIPLLPLWSEYERIIKANGAIILFGQSLFTAELICSNKAMYRYTLIWEKTRAGGFLNARRMPLQCHEDIAVFYKKLPTYNPQMEEGKAYSKKQVSNGDYGNYGKFERTGHVLVNEGLRYPRSIIKLANANNNSLHPTQKPLDLIRYLVRTYTNKDETVLDNCMGSGTTAVACIKERRHFIGFETDKGYFDIANKRIDEARKALSLFPTSATT